MEITDIIIFLFDGICNLKINTIRRQRPYVLITHFLGKLLGLGLGILNCTDHVEGRLWETVVRTRKDLLEGSDGIFKGNELALIASEDLGNLERLGHETLDLTSTLNLKAELSWKT